MDFLSSMSTATSTPRFPKVTLLALVGVACVWTSTMAGCRSARDNQIDILERELRSQEDYIYELEDYVLEYSEKLRNTRCAQPHSVVTESKTTEPVLAPPRKEEKPASPPADELPEPTTSEPEPSEPSSVIPDELDIPELEFDEPEPVGEIDEPIEEPAYISTQLEEVDVAEDETVFFEDESVELATAHEETQSAESASESEFLRQLFEDESPESNHRVPERLVITEVYRGDAGTESPANLLTVVEARDANNEPVDLDGKVSLMIMTPDPVSPQRLKRWDFTEVETAAAWQSTLLGDGLHLELPVGESLLPNSKLELWVRLVGSDGRKLLAQLPFQWEQLASIETAMEAQQLPANKAVQLAENGVRPLRSDRSASLGSTGEDQQESDQGDHEDRKSSWRASMRQSHELVEGFATTSSTQKSWSAQPSGGREPLPLRTALRQDVDTSPTTTPTRQAPVWTAGRSSTITNAAGESTTSGEQPQWSPPDGNSSDR